MRLERLVLHNMTSLGHVDLDLTSLPPGLVALVGDYGSGKTTILESPFGAFYRTLPSRDGDLKDYATAKDSYLDVRLAVDGVGAFRARVNIDAVRGTSDAVLQQIQPDGTAINLNDGKVTTFDQAVRQRFPSSELMLASAIATQNKRGNFIAKKPKEKNELFAELLGLQDYARMSEAAKQAAAVTEAERAKLVAALTELARGLGDAMALAQTETQLREKAAHMERVRSALAETIAACEATYEKLRAVQEAHAVAANRVATIKAEAAIRRQEYDGFEPARDRLIAERDEDLKALRRRHEDQVGRTEGKRDAAVADLDRRIAKNKDIQSRSETIQKAVDAVAALTVAEAGLRARIAEARTAKEEASIALAAAQQDLARRAQIQTQRSQACGNAVILQTVPFGDQCAEAGCSFVENAAAAKASIPALETALAAMAGLDQAAAAVSALWATHDATLTTLLTLEHQLTDDKAREQAVAKDAENLAVATVRIEERTAARDLAIKECTDRLAQLAADLTRSQAERTARWQAETNALHARAVTVEGLLGRLEKELEEASVRVAVTQDGSARAAITAAALAAARQDWDATTTELVGLTGELAHVQAVQRTHAAAVGRSRQIDARLVLVNRELLDWQQLQRALGRDGLPTLEIDAAGPLISQTTNDLLEAAFGPRFSVDLVTQQAKADGGMKDSFDLLVLDNAHGGEVRKIGDLSGGEQVIVGEALMNALALYVNLRADIKIGTAWRDETVGSLNADARVQYMSMLRRVHAIGGYGHIIFVTHNDEIAELADAQIRVANGTAAIVTPPYAPR